MEMLNLHGYAGTAGRLAGMQICALSFEAMAFRQGLLALSRQSREELWNVLAGRNPALCFFTSFPATLCVACPSQGFSEDNYIPVALRKKPTVPLVFQG